jgi:L-amino acid N-acyltransferase YncA
MTQGNLRMAEVRDAARILEIYAPSILESGASFETSLPSLADFQQRMQDYQAQYPWIVCEVEGRVVAYAYGSSHRSRCAYGWSAESSVYVDKSWQGRGLGKILYRELFELLKIQGVVNIFTGITEPNSASVALHKSLGFSAIGSFKDVGFKLGRWWNVSWWQLQLQKPLEPQALQKPPRHFSKAFSLQGP